MSSTRINLEHFAATGADAPTLIELLRMRAEAQPHSTAYTFLLDGEAEEQSYTYAELDARARAVAAWLQAEGAEGERVLLLYPPGLEFVAAFFGCLYAGAVAVPAYPPRMNHSLGRLQAIITDAGAKFVLTTQGILSKVSAFFEQAPFLKLMRWLDTEGVGVGLADAWREPRVDGSTLAFLQYTSGSTSTPKGVMVSHGNLLHNERLIQRVCGHTEESTFAGWLPLYHDMGLIGNVLQPLYLGAHCVLMSPVAFLQKPLRWLQAISRYRAQTSGAPNFAYDLCVRKVSPAERETLDLSSWRTAFNGAEPIRHDTIERFTRAFGPCGFRREVFFPCYGLAEATLIVSGGGREEPPISRTFSQTALAQNVAAPVEDDGADSRVLVSSGRKILEQEIRVVDPESLTECAPGRVGEIWVSGPSVAQGYWRRPEQTAQTFNAYVLDTGAGPFLRTGDLGFMQEGELFVTGRLKDLIIIRGRNHYPQDIELTVERAHAALRPGCGAAFAVEVGGEERLVVVQEADARNSCEPSELFEAVRRAVGAEHELEVFAVVLLKQGRIFKTSSGKIQRHACRNAFVEGTLEALAVWRADEEQSASANGPSDEITKPRDEVEAWLVAAVASKLGVEERRLDVTRPLAHYGLDSLAAIELAHSIETRLGVALPPTSFLQDFTLAQLAERARLTASEASDANRTSDAREDQGDEGVAYPLSRGQEALWFLHRLAPESTAYNISNAVRLRGVLDASALERAFRALVARHPALRTSFHVVEGRPAQRVEPHAELDFELTDASGFTGEELNARLEADTDRAFDLERGRLLRVRLFKLAPDEHVLLLVMHHIVTDLWSMAVLMNEFGRLYEEERGGASASLAPAVHSYAGFVRRQSRALAGVEGERLRSYWRSQLEGAPHTLQLPTDRPRPAAQTYNGAAVRFTLGAELTARLKALGHARETTLYTTLLAAFEALLHRYTRQSDFIVGSPAAGRTGAEWAEVVGYFTNILALRADCSGDPTFEEFLSRTRRSALGALEHQDYPFPQLVEQLQPERDMSRPPLFQVAFALQKAPRIGDAGLSLFTVGGAGARMLLGGLSLEAFPLKQRVAQFDLTLLMAESGEGLHGQLEFNTDLFDAETAERLVRHLETLLEAVAADPARTLSTLPLLPAPERRQLLNDWNATARDYADGTSLLHELFERQVERTPDSAALVFEGERLTYSQLNERSNRLAHLLRSEGVGADSLVGVMLERCSEMVVSLLAVLKAGGAYVPLDPSYPAERLSYMLSDSRPAVLLTHGKLSSLLPGSDDAPRIILLDADAEALSTQSGENLSRVAGASNLAYMIYTSGSTGRPKGAMNTHEAIVNRLLWMQEEYGLDSSDAVMQKTPFSFDVSVWEFFWPLMTGARLVVAQPGGHQDPSYLSGLIRSERVTTMHFVPSMLQAFLSEHDLSGCGSLRRVICSGEALPYELQQRFFSRLGSELHNLYGPTEAAVDVTFWECEREGSREVVPIGRPIANTQIYVLDARLEPVPVGVAGELYIAGAGLARGYHGRPELTAEKFVADPYSLDAGARMYRTGDLARWAADGAIEYLGRIDNQVKIRGNRIELGEIEAALSEHAGVQEAVVVPHEYASGDVRLVAYVVPDPQRAATLRRLFRLEESGRLAGKARYELPDGSLVVHKNKGETDFMYQEIVEDRTYEQHGITLGPGACVFDVGANIGLFSLSVGRACPGARVYAFEPVPEIFDLLCANAELYGLDVRPFNCGLSDSRRTETFTYYPHVSVVSGVYAEDSEQREVVKAFVANQAGAGDLGLSAEALDELVGERLTSERITCELMPLSEVIREQKVERIDLLKIDVEKSELDVLAGIGEEDWKKIRQVVVEVHDIEGRLAHVTSMLTARGFDVTARQDTALRDTGLYNVYAVARGVERAPSNGAGEDRQTREWHSPERLVADVRERLASKLPAYMIPSEFVLLEALPLSPNGKLDRRQLPAPESRRTQTRAAFAEPRTELEKTIAEVWREALRVEQVGLDDKFFELGGHSLLMAQVQTRLRARLGREISMVELFKFPTVGALALHLSEGAAANVMSQPPAADLSRKLSAGKDRLKRLQRQGQREGAR